MAKSEEELRIEQTAHYIKIGAIVVVGLIVILFFSPFVIVPAGNRGIMLTWGQVTATLPEGLSFKIPIVQGVVLMNVQTQKFEAEATSASKDLQDVHTKVALNYHILADKTGEIYKLYGVYYADNIVSPAVQEVVKMATAKFTAEELITKRPTVKETIDNELLVRLSKYDLVVETISITNFEFSPDFTQSIEAKVTAQQNALKAENDLTRIKIEAEQKIATARAEAESIRLQNEQLMKSKDVLVLRWIQKWDGKLPLVYGGQLPALLNMGLNINENATVNANVSV
jgi:regulator of protease activity HflC (stomatin/prohibitin superfamily)